MFKWLFGKYLETLLGAAGTSLEEVVGKARKTAELQNESNTFIISDMQTKIKAMQDAIDLANKHVEESKRILKIVNGLS